MGSFENKAGISQITFKQRTSNWSPIGKETYTNQFSVSILPGKTIPDYVDLHKTINEKVNGKSLSVEDAVALVFDIVNVYSPRALTVKSYVDDSVHFPVEVMKSANNDK